MCLTTITTTMDATNSTFNCSSSTTPRTPTSAKWDTDKLNYFVKNGIFTQIYGETQHIALHPYWLSNPLQGLKEKFHDSVGKLRPKSNGYLVAYENVRIDRTKIVAINVDHPWLHTDIKATVYTYTPAVGQILRGVVKKIGENAAICAMFHYFSVTVHPEEQSQLSTWTIGNELEFTVKCFRNRRNGPLIQATFIQKLSEYKDASFMNFNNTTFGEFQQQDESTPATSNNFELNINLSRKLKTTKNKKITFNDDDEVKSGEIEDIDTPASSNNFELNLNLSKKLKTKKNKKITFNDDDEVVEMEVDSSLLASPTKRLKIDQDIVDGIGEEEDEPIPEKKKKKHKSKD